MNTHPILHLSAFMEANQTHTLHHINVRRTSQGGYKTVARTQENVVPRNQSISLRVDFAFAFHTKNIWTSLESAGVAPHGHPSQLRRLF